MLAPEVGYFARLAASPTDGALATVDVGRDAVPHLTVRERDGSPRFRRSLTQFLPGRRWISTHPLNMSGLSFTADGQSLFLVAADVDALGSYLSRVWRVDARTGEVVRTWEGLEGMGGGVTPDGQAYVFVQVQGDTANLVRLELATGARTPLTHFEGRCRSGLRPCPPTGASSSPASPRGDGTSRCARPMAPCARSPTTRASTTRPAGWTRAGSSSCASTRAAGRRTCSTSRAASPCASPMRPTSSWTWRRSAARRWSSSTATASTSRWMPRPSSRPPRPGRSPWCPPPPWSPPPRPPPRPRGAPARHPLRRALLPLEHFFLPELRAPYVYALPDASAPGRFIGYGGLLLAGQDRLGFHQYALGVEADTRLRNPSLTFDYGNALPAPWYLRLSAARVVQEGRRDLQASLSLSRTFWTTPVSFSLLGLRRDWYATSKRPGVRTSLLGPSASVSYFAGESTSYGGTQRGIGLALGAGVYPLAFDDTRPFADVRAELSAYLPGLPFVRRDNLQLSLVGRVLPQAPEGLLQVGGVPLGSFALQRRQGPEDTRNMPLRLQPGLSFVENLRGYEDFALSARHVLIATARYRYRLIFDHGWTSLLWLAPSFFISQLEAEAFGTWARTDGRANHRAVGGAFFLRTRFGQAFPVSLFYQYARRFDDGLGHLHLVGIAL
ncbi:TolB family protein [Cystobacter fuscus]